jgi:hypothetical protein
VLFRFVEALVKRSCLSCTPGVESLVQLAVDSVVSNYTLLAPHFGTLPVELQDMLRHEATFSPGTEPIAPFWRVRWCVPVINSFAKFRCVRTTPAPRPEPEQAPTTMRGAVYAFLSSLVHYWDGESLREVLQALSPFLSRSAPRQFQYAPSYACYWHRPPCGTHTGECLSW